MEVKCNWKINILRKWKWEAEVGIRVICWEKDSAAAAVAGSEDGGEGHAKERTREALETGKGKETSPETPERNTAPRTTPWVWPSEACVRLLTCRTAQCSGLCKPLQFVVIYYSSSRTLMQAALDLPALRCVLWGFGDVSSICSWVTALLLEHPELSALISSAPQPPRPAPRHCWPISFPNFPGFDAVLFLGSSHFLNPSSM